MDLKTKTNINYNKKFPKMSVERDIYLIVKGEQATRPW